MRGSATPTGELERYAASVEYLVRLEGKQKHIWAR